MSARASLHQGARALTQFGLLLIGAIALAEALNGSRDFFWGSLFFAVAGALISAVAWSTRTRNTEEPVLQPDARRRERLHEVRLPSPTEPIAG
jgi:hypothetical protein